MLEISYSIEDEIERIKYTLGKYQWYLDNGYKPNLPIKVLGAIKESRELTNDFVETSVKEEWVETDYSNKKAEILQVWGNEGKEFMQLLQTLGRPLQKKYYINLTKYGVGGSYGYPQDIQLNICNSFKKGVLWTIFHEMVHLTIEDLIQKYNIEHWTKERLVNLIMNRFFPEKAVVQKDPDNAEKIYEIFKTEFPHIEEIIQEISKLNK